MKRKLLILVLIMSTMLSCGQNFSHNVKDFSPSGKYNNIINHTYYKLSYAEVHEQAEWVMYNLQSNKLDIAIKRKNNFKEDKKIKTGSAQLSDYKGSGFDRGHLAPAADMKYSNASMNESFYMSNMSPQRPKFNQQIWKKIEAQFRTWGDEYGEIIIITGPVLNGEYLGSIGSNKVTVPKYYYKVAIDPKNIERNIAILIENKESSENIKNFIVSIDSLESITDIDFFYRLDDSLEKKIESSTHENLWYWRSNLSNHQRSNHKTKEGNISLFRTISGSKYHKEGCRHLSKSKIPTTLNELKNSSLRPCSVCKP